MKLKLRCDDTWSKETIQRVIDLELVPERLQAIYSDPISQEEFAEY
ncbi:hypothetical protein [Cytobacillus sp. IB215665]|nr:hypothetical protein [Cytobacillus sp. IB215665]MDX8363929.1 hypothetical protein [Cytobacillus sp. IB215665]